MSNTTQKFFDPKAYFEAKRIDYATEGPNISQGWIGINCPWCGDKLKHLGINPENNRVVCWRCGGHNIGKLVQLIEDCSWSEAMEIMEKYQNFRRPEEPEGQIIIPPGYIEIPKEFVGIEVEIPKLVATFLHKRGLSAKKTVHDNELYYSGHWGLDYKFRILIPVYIQHKLVTFMTRDVTGKSKTPYISQPPNEAVIPCKHTLYGYDEITPGSKVILVEGPIDQWKLGRGSLATWGTGWTIEQVKLLRTLYPSKVYILYDSEETAQERAKKLAKAIWFCDTEVMYLDNHKDPGELTLEEGREVMKELINGLS